MIFLYFFSGISLTLGDKLDCCETKENGDSIYKLVRVDEDITKKYNCRDGCIYEDTNEDGSRFCFRYGGEHNSTCNVGETESVLTIIENGQEVKQTVSFNNYTEIVTIDVPPHVSDTQENFTQATTTFDTKTNTNVIKSNNSCVLSDIPDYINVTGIPEYFQKLKEGTATWNNENKDIVYDIKTVKSVVSPEERKKLTPALNSLCNNEVIKKTENKRISKENYKKLMNDEIIFINEISENKRQGCVIDSSACISDGPASCGNLGWENPVTKKSISMHEVTSKSRCVLCCKDTSNDRSCNCTADFPEFCACTDIINKNNVTHCIFKAHGGQSRLKFQDTPDSVRKVSGGTQLLTYNSETDTTSIKIHVPSHGDVEETTVLMHAHTSGYWHRNGLANNMMMKVGSRCHIRTLPRDVYPVDIALGLNDIDAGNFTLKPEDEKKKHKIIMNDGPLNPNDERNLNPEIQEMCQNSEVTQYQEIDVDEAEFETLSGGGIIFVTNNINKRSCEFLTAATAKNKSLGCWRWPNPDGQEISVHGLVSSIINVTCCVEHGSDCCKDDELCICKDIINEEMFEQCMVPVSTDLSSQDSSGQQHRQRFAFSRKEGHLSVHVDAHENNTETTVVLSKSEGLQLLKKGESCHLLPLGKRDPKQIAENADEVAKKISGSLIPEMETVSRTILVPRSGPIPALPDYMDCGGINITLADQVPVDETQFQDLEDGKVVTLTEGHVRSSHDSDEIEKCVLQTVCVSNNSKISVRWPNSNTEPPFIDHEIATTTTCQSCCIEGMDPNYCECEEITDMETFQQCLRRDEMILVITGAQGKVKYNLVDRFVRNESSPSLQLKALSVNPKMNFPVETSGGVGVWFNNSVIACQGTGDVPDGCYEMNLATKSWTQGGDYEYLVDPLVWGGASAKYKSGPNRTEPGETWWIIGGDRKGTRTQEWNSVEGIPPWNPPVLPFPLNTPCCMVAISDRHIFVTGTPIFQPADTNLAWIFSWDYKLNGGWRVLPSLREKRFGAACGFLPNSTNVRSGWIVVAGGHNEKSTEILDVSNCLEEDSVDCTWVPGPDLHENLNRASIVTLTTGDLVLFGDQTDILALNFTFAKWEVVGRMSQPRSSAVVLAIN